MRRAVELIRCEIMRLHPETAEVNAVLIDFFLYDLAKEKEASGKSCSPRVCTLTSVALLVMFISLATVSHLIRRSVPIWPVVELVRSRSAFVAPG